MTPLGLQGKDRMVSLGMQGEIASLLPSNARDNWQIAGWREEWRPVEIATVLVQLRLLGAIFALFDFLSVCILLIIKILIQYFQRKNVHLWCIMAHL
jgi:hypothetical protein